MVVGPPVCIFEGAHRRRQFPFWTTAKPIKMRSRGSEWNLPSPISSRLYGQWSILKNGQIIRSSGHDFRLALTIEFNHHEMVDLVGNAGNEPC